VCVLFYKGNPLDALAVWSGGLEFLGGVVMAVCVMILYCILKKLPALKFLDILAPTVMLGLAFGRIGCLLNGCCFGQPSSLPWAIRFPTLNTHITQEGPVSRYSIPYQYQLDPDEQRSDLPLMDDVLPADYYTFFYFKYDQRKNNTEYITKDEFTPEDQKQCRMTDPKPLSELTNDQIEALKNNEYPMHTIHPAQIYSSLNALFLCLLLNFLFRFYKFPGQIIASMLILYGLSRFLLEMVRCEPYIIDHLTASQAIGIVSFIIGGLLLVITGLLSKRQIKPKE
jgi:phosphatidylglycerol---prolipoprotein diacylglyceryl transferase